MNGAPTLKASRARSPSSSKRTGRLAPSPCAFSTPTGARFIRRASPTSRGIESKLPQSVINRAEGDARPGRGLQRRDHPRFEGGAALSFCALELGFETTTNRLYGTGFCVLAKSSQDFADALARYSVLAGRSAAVCSRSRPCEYFVAPMPRPRRAAARAARRTAPAGDQQARRIGRAPPGRKLSAVGRLSGVP